MASSLFRLLTATVSMFAIPVTLRAQQPTALPPFPLAPPAAPVTQPTTRPIALPPGAVSPGAQVIYVMPDPTAGIPPTMPPMFPPPMPPGFEPPYVARATPVDPADVAQTASVMIQIDGGNDPRSGANPMDPNAAAALLSSTALVDAAAHAALGFDAGQRAQRVVVNSGNPSYRYTRVDVILRKVKGVEYQPDDARKLALALRDFLLAAIQESARVQQEVFRNRARIAEAELEQGRKQLAAIQTKTRAVREMLGTERGDVMPQLRSLKSQRQNLEREVTQLRIRLKQMDPGAAPLVNEWEALVKLREQRLAELKQKASGENASEADIKEQEIRLAEAKAQLASARSSGGAGAEGVRRDRADEIIMLRSQLNENEEKLKTLTDQVAKLEDPKNADLLREWPELQDAENRLRNEVNELEARAETARRGMRSEPPATVTILDGLLDADGPLPQQRRQ